MTVEQIRLGIASVIAANAIQRARSEGVITVEPADNLARCHAKSPIDSGGLAIILFANPERKTVGVFLDDVHGTIFGPTIKKNNLKVWIVLVKYTENCALQVFCLLIAALLVADFGDAVHNDQKLVISPMAS